MHSIGLQLVGPCLHLEYHWAICSFSGILSDKAPERPVGAIRALLHECSVRLLGQPLSSLHFNSFDLRATHASDAYHIWTDVLCRVCRYCGIQGLLALWPRQLPRVQLLQLNCSCRADTYRGRLVTKCKNHLARMHPHTHQAGDFTCDL